MSENLNLDKTCTQCSLFLKEENGCIAFFIYEEIKNPEKHKLARKCQYFSQTKKEGKKL